MSQYSFRENDLPTPRYTKCVLHVAPEAAIGGPINFVQDGDIITLDVEKRLLSMDVSEEELARRKSSWVPAPPPPSGYARLFHDRIEGEYHCLVRVC